MNSSDLMLTVCWCLCGHFDREGWMEMLKSRKWMWTARTVLPEWAAVSKGCGLPRCRLTQLLPFSLSCVIYKSCHSLSFRWSVLLETNWIQDWNQSWFRRKRRPWVNIRLNDNCSLDKWSQPWLLFCKSEKWWWGVVMQGKYIIRVARSSEIGQLLGNTV